MAVFIVERGKQVGLRFEVLDDSAPTLIGRDATLDIALDDERASRLHAKVLRQRGEWLVEDLGSRNGFFFRGQPVKKAVIRNGDVIQIGSTLLRLQEGERVDPL